VIGYKLRSREPAATCNRHAAISEASSKVCDGFANHERRPDEA